MIKPRHFLTLLDRTPEELQNLINTAIKLKEERQKGIKHRELEGKTLAMIFEKSSTRTRISFETGMYELGGHPMFLSNRDIQLGRGETIKDTARVLSRYVHGIMIRTFGHERVEELAEYSSVPVINALTDSFHPCQIMADMMTMQEKFGKIKGLKVAYVGDGNNMAHSWINGAAQMGFHIAIASPKGYWVDYDIVDKAKKIAENNGGTITLTHKVEEAVDNAHVVYTDVWASMGQEEESQKRIKDFQGYQITSDVMKLALKGAVFMHCLPAHRGEEVSEEVLESENSVIFDEAENRLHVQKAILIDCIGGI